MIMWISVHIVCIGCRRTVLVIRLFWTCSPNFKCAVLIGDIASDKRGLSTYFLSFFFFCIKTYVAHPMSTHNISFHGRIKKKKYQNFKNMSVTGKSKFSVEKTHLIWSYDIHCVSSSAVIGLLWTCSSPKFKCAGQNFRHTWILPSVIGIEPQCQKMCVQQRFRSACAFLQSDQILYWVHFE